MKQHSLQIKPLFCFLYQINSEFNGCRVILRMQKNIFAQIFVASTSAWITNHTPQMLTLKASLIKNISVCMYICVYIYLYMYDEKLQYNSCSFSTLQNIITHWHFPDIFLCKDISGCTFCDVDVVSRNAIPFQADGTTD